MPLNGFGSPSPGAMNGAMRPNLAPPPAPPMPNMGPAQGPMPLTVDPTSLGLPPGSVLYDDGSVKLPAGSFPMANQTGGANPLPPGMPPGFGSPGGMFGEPIPPGMTPPPPVPQQRGAMPGQPPPPPADPSAMDMLSLMQPPAPPPPGPNLSVPGGASITNGMPKAAPSPKPDYQQRDELGGKPGGKRPQPGMKKPMPKKR